MNPRTSRSDAIRQASADSATGGRRSAPSGFPVLVDVAGIARLLGVEVRMVRRLVFERRIPYVKVGKYVRFDVAEVAAWVRRQQVREVDRASLEAKRR